MNDDFYTYELAYPESMGGAVFYVGKGCGYRWLDHEREARQGVQSHKCNVIRKIWNHGEQVARRKRHTDLSESAAYQEEIALIRSYGRENLTNLTDGGEVGGPGRPVERKATYRAITLEIRSDLLASLDAQIAQGKAKSRREYVEVALEQFLAK